MNIKYLFNLIVLLLLAGCSNMYGTVIDAKTGQPIEDAVIYVDWAIKKGVSGLQYEKDYAVAETVTDINGKFKVSGVLNPFVSPPTVVIYKKGYVAWRNDYIFPDYQHRAGFEWKGDKVINLEPFKRYSHSQHVLFLRSGLSLNASSKLSQAYAWEDSLATKEEELAAYKRKKKGASKYTEKELWQEVIDELYPEQ